MTLLRPETPAEFHIVRCAREGRVADFGDVPDDRAHEKTVRGGFLRDLLMLRLEDASVAPISIAVGSALIEGDLSCRNFASPGSPLPPFELSNCEIRGTLDLADSCWTSVVLNRSTLRGLIAPGLRVDEGLAANNIVLDFEPPAAMDLDVVNPIAIDLSGLISGAAVDLTGLGRNFSARSDGFGFCSLNLAQCHIEGNLILSGACLQSLDDFALFMQRAVVAGSIFLDASGEHRFESRGSVWMSSAKIGGQINFIGAYLENNKDAALSMDSVEVKGLVTLASSDKHRFEAKGTVSLWGCQIGSGINCIGGSFESEQGSALQMENMEVKGGVNLRSSDRYRFEAKGTLSLLGSIIIGTVDCTGAALTGTRPTKETDTTNGTALSLERADVTGGVLLRASNRHRFEARGALLLWGARIKGEVNCIGASIENPNGNAILMDGAEVSGGVYLRAFEGGRFEANGTVSLVGAKIIGALDCGGANLRGARVTRTTEGKVENTYGAALTLEHAQVTGNVFWGMFDQHRFEVKGETRLLGAKIGGQLNCVDASLENVGGNSLVMDTAEVAGGVFLKSDKGRFEAKGALTLAGAKIGGRLDCSGANLENANGYALMMDSADITGSVFLRASDRVRFESKGTISLTDAKIIGAIDCTGAKLTGILPKKEDDPPNGQALTLERAEVTGGVFLRASEANWFETAGTINLYGAKIGGALQFQGRLTSARSAIILDMAVVHGHLRLYLVPGSSGTASLRGTRVEELDDNGGDGWGKKPNGRPEQKDATDVVLKLDGFTYERFGEWKETPPEPTGFGRLTRFVRRVFGKGIDRGIWRRRTQWLERQYAGKKPKVDDFFPQPHEQLAKTLRLMGHSYDARRVSVHKFDHERQCRAGVGYLRPFMFLYRWCFGYGYLPVNALVTVLLWLALGTAGVCWALGENKSGHVVLVRSLVPVEVVQSLTDPDAAPRSPTFDQKRDKLVAGHVVYGPHDKVQSRDVPCSGVSPPLYALDLMLPFVGLRIADRCEMADEFWWLYGKAAYEMIGWLIVAMTALTWTGILRKDPG